MSIEAITRYEIEYLSEYPKSHRYVHGLPFSTKLAENLDALADRVESKKASLIVVDGGVGEGKTTLAVQIANYLQRGQIVFEKQLALGGEQLMAKLKVCYENKLAVVIYDEAGDFNKRNALSRFNQILNRVFETFRTFKIIVIACLPNFNILDGNLFDNKIPRLLLHLKGRTSRQGNFYGYSLYGMLWLRFWMKKNPAIKEDAFKRVHPNFVGHFLDLPPATSKELDGISTKGKLSFLDKGELQMSGLVSYQEIMKKTGKTYEWCRIMIMKLKIKPVRVQKKVRYFNESVIDMLLSEINKRKKEED